MLFAEISDTVWLAIIGVIAMAVKEYFDSSRARRAEEKIDVAARKAEQAVEETKAGNLVVAKVQASQSITNERIDGMKTELVEAAKGQYRAEGMLAGIETEQTRVARDIQDIKANGGAEHHESAPVPVTVVPAEAPLPVTVIIEKRG